MRLQAIVVLLVVTLASGRGWAQQVGAPTPVPVFSDDFKTDTRADYKITDDVSWETGRLMLSDGASIERVINGGPWATAELGLDPPELTADKPKSELRIWFILNGASNCYVRIRRELKDRRLTNSVALVDTGVEDGKLVESLVRQVDVDRGEFSAVSLSYRNGLVHVKSQERVLLRAWISNGLATVAAARTEATRLPVRLTRWDVAATPRPTREFTTEEKEQLAAADVQQRQVFGLYGQGKFAEAAEIMERVRATKRSVLGERHLGFVASLYNLGEVYRASGDFKRAATLIRQALDIQRPVLGEGHPEYANGLNNLGAVYFNLGEFARAAPFFRQALDIQKSVLGEQDPSYAVSLNNLGMLYESMGDYGRAETSYAKALDIQKSLLGERHPSYTVTLSNLAATCKSLGEFARSEKLFKQALEIQRSVLGEEHPAYTNSLANLAALYESMGDFARAEPLYKQALEIQKSGQGEPSSYAAGMNNLAMLYGSMGDFARAETLYKQALEIQKSVLGERHPQYASSLNNLAGLYRAMGDFARAEPLIRQTIEIDNLVLSEQDPKRAASLNNLAGLYRAMGEFNRAETLYSQALDLQKSALGDGHPDYAASLNNLAVLYERMGDDARAEPLFKRAIEIDKAVLGERHPDYAYSLDSLAGLYNRQGDYARAEPLSRQAVEVIRDVLDRSSAVQSERQQKRHQFEDRHYLDLRLSIARNSGAAPVEGLETLWRWKGAVTFRQGTYRRVAGNTRVAPLFKSLQSVTRQLSVISGRTPIPPAKSATADALAEYEQDRSRWAKQFAALTREREDIEDRIAADSAEFQQVQEPLTVATVRQLLPPGTAFVDFVDYNHASLNPRTKDKDDTDDERRFIAFVVTRERDPVLIGLGSVESLGAAVTAFRRPFTREQSGRAAAQQAAGRLRQELWLPLEKHLEGIHTLIISPDTILGTLPWAALPGPKEGSYLIEQYRFGSLPMVALLRSLLDEGTKRPQTDQGLLVLGDVQYDANARVAPVEPESTARPAWVRRSAPLGVTRHWRSLPGFQQELLVVRDNFEKEFGDGVTTLRGSEATEAEFIKQAARHYNLHLVTHGYFAKPEFEAIGAGNTGADDFDPGRRTRLGRDPRINQYLPGLLSGIVLAGANNPPPEDNPSADGILTASEIETLDLNAVDLVVLSACETGLGKTAGGEGLTGLQRAFHVAGVRSCIATLWEVDDKASLELMSRFYRYYWRDGQSKIDALRNAQLEVLRNRELTRGEPRNRKQPAAPDKRKTQRTDPRYWAAFVLSGDWR